MVVICFYIIFIVPTDKLSYLKRKKYVFFVKDNGFYKNIGRNENR